VDLPVPFGIYDVFATRPFDGNQAAVVEADALSTHQFVTLAGEFLLPETVHLQRRASRLILKFATAAGPIARCGHGMLAAIAHVVLNPTADAVCLTGEYEVDNQRSHWTASETSAHSVRVSITWPDRPRRVGEYDGHQLLPALGLDPGHLSATLPAGIYNSGNRNALVPLARSELLDALSVNWSALEDVVAKHDLTDVQVYTVQEIGPGQEVRLRCRNVFPYGVREEAATGSAAVSLAAAFCDSSVLAQCPADEITFFILQGVSDRRGHLTVRVNRRTGADPDFQLEGTVYRIATGRLVSIPKVTSGGHDNV
jgi:PhzF family phenazine biosynthesis protein